MPYIEAFAPGRTEIAGNHTDHQGGRVIAGAVDCGIRLTMRPNGRRDACVNSVGFPAVAIELSHCEPIEAERFSSAALVRGIVAGFRSEGVSVDGFDADLESGIPAGGGLSSSAAFELVIAQALNECFADGALDPQTLARISQAAERDWFGKPCGLMDQLAVALGGVNVMDFSQGGCTARRIDFDFEKAGLAIALVDVHCDHSAYTTEYAQVAIDMDAVAELLGAQKLSEVDEGEYLLRFEEVRRQLGDVAALRGLHYYHEMELVDKRLRALECGDVEAFLGATRQSGASSAQYLQNVSTYGRYSQPAMVALALSDRFLGGRGAARIHGGGFGGTIQVFVPIELYDSFKHRIDEHLGEGSCRRYRISSRGACARWVSS